MNSWIPLFSSAHFMIHGHEFMRHEFMDSKSMNSRGNSRVTHASPTAGSHHEPTASELSRSYGYFRFAHAFDAVCKAVKGERVDRTRKISGEKGSSKRCAREPACILRQASSIQAAAMRKRLHLSLPCDGDQHMRAGRVGCCPSDASVSNDSKVISLSWRAA